jgi:hypothetical protein
MLLKTEKFVNACLQSCTPQPLRGKSVSASQRIVAKKHARTRLREEKAVIDSRRMQLAIPQARKKRAVCAGSNAK